MEKLVARSNNAECALSLQKVKQQQKRDEALEGDHAGAPAGALSVEKTQAKGGGGWAKL